MSESQIRSNCLIIGGGVVGLSLAYELAKRGLGVQVLDQSEVGHGASWAGAGILPPSPVRGAVDTLDQLRGMSHRLHAEWAAELRSLTGIDTGYARCGGIYLARSMGEFATLAAQQGYWYEHGIEAELWTGDTAQEREPSLAPLLKTGSVKAAWFLPNECQLRNPRHLRALAAACMQLGVTIHEHVVVEHVESVVDNGIEVIAGERRFRAEQACICSGAWSRLLLDRLAIETGLLPVRGQMVLYNTGQVLLKHVVNEGHRYLVARDDGRLLAGSCEEEVGYDTSTTDAMLRQIREWAESILPQLRDCSVERTWAGLRPASFDGLPYIGQVPHRKRLFVATGHFRAGLHLSCATAVVMADLMQGRLPEIDLTAFRIGRG
jgi:glycine oxidase